MKNDNCILLQLPLPRVCSPQHTAQVMGRSTSEAQGLVLLVSWLISLSLANSDVQSCLSQSLVEQMLYADESLDLLRPEATALSQVRCRKGLPVQPFFWALTLAMVDITNLRYRGITRHEADRGSLTSLETRQVETRVEDEVCALVELAQRSLRQTPPALGDSLTAMLYGGCNLCPDALSCFRFCSTPCRPELCVCHHGAAHHVAIDPFSVTEEAGSEKESDRSSQIRAAQQLRAVTQRIPWLAKLMHQSIYFLTSIGAAGVRDLLGLKRTTGSIEGLLPPSRRTLLAALNKPHLTTPLNRIESPNTMTELCPAGSDRGRSKPGQKKGRIVVCNLSVGGRALCKHAVRGREGWWGTSGGTESDKNERAEKAVLDILSTATWVNIHVFGGGGQDGVLEVRQAQGYGARWSVDGTIFRGFLEPHMEDGHSRGWRH